MNLAKVSELTKVSPRMLRYYENLGLIPVSYTHLTLPTTNLGCR
ncbi:MerR family DNA-binding transcriptional regulator, partial [Acinetobacter baumannii]